MNRVYALLVGIDAYPDPVRPLAGCRDDVADARRHLLAAGVPEDGIRELVDAAATKAAVVAAFREHLGRAGSGDSVLFWFSGHGSTAPVLPEGWHLESSGATMQTLVCVDSRGPDGADLLDKELAMLISEVAAGGPHVAVVLDCCHSGGLTRTPPSIGIRFTGPGRTPGPDALLPGLREWLARARPPRERADHVSLAACQSRQPAHELPGPDGVRRGVFSLGLLGELRRPGAARTYRELMTAVRSRVENHVDGQTPVLFPAAEPIVDQPFLGGQVRMPVASMAMRELHGRWVVDAGSCHGLDPLDTAARVAVHGDGPFREARVVAVSPGRSVVEPLGWEPVPGTVYPVVLSAVALPRTAVTVGGDTGDDERAARAVRAAVEAAGPGGGRSPYLRLVPRDALTDRPELVVTTPAEGGGEIRSADGVFLAAAATGPGGPAPREVVERLEHIARWRQVRAIGNPTSRLAGLVRLELVPALPGDVHAPRDREVLRPGASGAVELEYQPYEYGFTPPAVFVRIRNASPRPLHCVLLNLTDQFRIKAGLFPGDFVDAGAAASADEGEPIDFRLPEDLPIRPGAQVRDWLMLIVSEDKINPESFALPELGTPGPVRHRGASALDGIVEHLALRTLEREAVSRPRTAADWCTSLHEVVTRVPDDGASCP